ncbi:phage tail protein [Kordiimonas aestuarii]|uniref:phage tail protein n=1 Tax=Kordiimonas aestuarii TaxID=1005925 RepID=UPI0021D18F04|nr:tail fiber protein [Kordiimonas aestuarii]
MFEEYLGVIKALGFQFTPENWNWCSGALIAINQNPGLFSLIGCQYDGDCRNSFGLPDLRGRIPVGYGMGPGLSPRALGERHGWPTRPITRDTLAAHSHSTSYNPAGGGNESETSVLVAETHGAAPAADGNYLAMRSNALGTATSGFTYVSAEEATTAGTVRLGGVATSGGGGGGFINEGLVVNEAGAFTPSLIDLTQPSLVVNYCICTEGLYPARS